MHRVTSGTFVPKSIDSPALPPDFKVPRRLKLPIIAVTMRYLGPWKWKITFMKRGQKPKSYHTSIGPVAYLTKVVCHLERMKFASISPEIAGWTAYVDRAVYPPPKEVQDV